MRPLDVVRDCKSKRRRVDYGQLREIEEEEEEEECNEILRYLFENVQGVILWVKVILEDLVASIHTGCYTISQVRQKLNRLPKDVNNMYEYITR